MEGPRWSPDLLDLRRGSIPSTHLPPPAGVCVLGSLPGPEGGISWGWLILCPSQTKELHKGATAKVSRRAGRHLEWRALPSDPRARFPRCIWKMAALSIRRGEAHP